MSEVKSEKASAYKISARSNGDEIIEAALQILQERFSREERLQSSSATKEFLILRAGRLEREVFSAVFLDNQHGVIAIEDLSMGTIDGAAVYPREVLKAALGHNAAAVIFTHNHPSGIPEPSRADIAITKKLTRALEFIEIRVLDHIVTGGGEAVSMAERDLL